MEGSDDCKTWVFDAPTYLDLENTDFEKMAGIEDYFNTNHEHSSSLSNKSVTQFASVNKLEDQNNNMRETFDGEEKIQIAVNTNQNKDVEFISNTTNIDINQIKDVSDMTSNVANNLSARQDIPELGKESSEHIKNGCSDTPDSVFNCLEKDVVDQPDSSVTILKLQDELDATKSQSIVEEICENVHEVMDDVTSTLQSSDSSSQVKASVENTVPSNIITPSRVACWERSSRQQRKSCAATISAKPVDRSSKPIEKWREMRRGGGNMNPSQSHPTDPPTKKRKKSNKVQLIEPVTPTVLKHARHFSTSNLKSSAQIELEEIQDLKFKAKQMAEESSKSFKRALKTPAANNIATSATVKSTKIKEFKFKTDERIKSDHAMDTRSRKLSSEVDYTKSLRQHPPSPKKLKKTIVKPFNLSSNRKRKIELETRKGYDFVPTAKAVMNFQRGGKILNNKASRSQKGPMKAKPILTVAKTPKLESRTRAREVTVISAKQLEDQEIEEMKNYNFKAKPVNREILDHVEMLPEVKKSSSTKPIGFDLEINKRIEARPKHDEPSTSSYEFKAQPAPKKILEGVVGVMKPEVILPTIPQSPAFALKNRMHIAQKRKANKENLEQEEKAKEAKILKNALHAVQKKAVKPKVSLENTEIKAFSFDTRDKERYAKKEEKIKSIIKTEKANHSAFRATPICQPSDLGISTVPKKKVTEPKPFQLSSDDNANKVPKWKKEVEANMRCFRENREFKANTNYTQAIYGEAFKPLKEKKVTVFEEFSLHSNERAMKRGEYDEWLKQKEADIQAHQVRQKEEQEEIEREEIEKLRKSAEHRANPIRNYKGVLIEGSTKKLTIPQSPQFSDRFCKK